MTSDQPVGEKFVRLALDINEHMPGYVDSYFGPDEWSQAAKQAGKIPLPELATRADQLAMMIAQADEMDAQRRDFLARQMTAMQMSLRLLQGEKVSLAEEVQALYDVQPGWKDESTFLEAQQRLDEILPKGDSLKERLEDWKKSLEIPVEKAREILPEIIERLRSLAHQKFDLPDEESFTIDFVSNEPWGAYNWYLGEYRSRIAINTDMPLRINSLPGLIAHEGYPGHHTELSIKEAHLIRQRNYHEHMLTLINAPSCVIAEGIATTALDMMLSDEEIEEWYREDILPRAGLNDIDAKTITAVRHAADQLSGVSGNAAFMLHDRNESPEEISLYARKYLLNTEKEAGQLIKFISNPLYRSYIFTYDVGYELLKELFTHGQREQYFARILREPVTPSQIQGWMAQR